MMSPLAIVEDEEPEATPLIPLTEECENSLQDKLFQRFLYTVGVNPPVNEQVRGYFCCFADDTYFYCYTTAKQAECSLYMYLYVFR